MFIYHSPVDGHLDYFHFFAITNNAAINIHTQVFLQTCIFICMYIEVELLGHMVTQHLTF